MKVKLILLGSLWLSVIALGCDPATDPQCAPPPPPPSAAEQWSPARIKAMQQEADVLGEKYAHCRRAREQCGYTLGDCYNKEQECILKASDGRFWPD